MDLETVMQELEALGKERMKKMYVSNGAREPVFGVATGAMKPMAKEIKKDQALAEELYATGNYDAMYFAGVIADPIRMTEADFDRWIEGHISICCPITWWRSPWQKLISRKLSPISGLRAGKN